MLTIPEVAPSLPQSLKTFFMRLEIPDPARQAIVIITETIQPPPEGKEILPFVFDIDVVRESSFSPTDPALWQALEELRDLKNESFFNSLTYKARELFK